MDPQMEIKMDIQKGSLMESEMDIQTAFQMDSETVQLTDTLKGSMMECLKETQRALYLELM